MPGVKIVEFWDKESKEKYFKVEINKVNEGKI